MRSSLGLRAGGEGRAMSQGGLRLCLAGPQLAARHPEPVPGHCGVDGAGECGYLCDPVQGESLALLHRWEWGGG